MTDPNTLFASLGLQDPPLQTEHNPVFADAGLQFSWLRLDQMHPTLGGNKWFKLKYNLAAILASSCHRVISFGGAWSNHLAALAEAGSRLGIETIGIVRGEIPHRPNPVMGHMLDCGMVLSPVSRSDYRRKESEQLRASLQRRWGPAWILPEGGSNALALRGLQEIVDYLPASLFKAEQPLLLSCASGTGATLAGLAIGCAERESHAGVLGVSVLKGEGYILDQIAALLREKAAQAELGILDHGAKLLERIQVHEHGHWGGYARAPAELMQWIAVREESAAVPVEPVYTAKMLYALEKLAVQGAFAPGSQFIAVHTGGVWSGRELG